MDRVEGGQDTEEDLVSRSKEAFLCRLMKEEKYSAELRSFQNFLEENSIGVLLNNIVSCRSSMAE
ncbi:2908_t:CDS:2 [Funneliformis geosporum]|nr:2908_t:CDS:2 [Funneliformis geosporum]